METESFNHTPIIVGMAGIVMGLLGAIWAGGKAWGKLDTRADSVEKWIEEHRKSHEESAATLAELKGITIRLDTLVEAHAPRIARLERHEDQEL